MTAETRRRIAAARQWLDRVPRDERAAAERREARVPRFSRGAERRPPALADLHVGRFSDGIELLPEDVPSKAHVGRFSDGAAPDQAA